MIKFGDSEIKKAREWGLPSRKPDEVGYFTVEKRLTDLRDEALFYIEPSIEPNAATTLRQNLCKARTCSTEIW